MLPLEFTGKGEVRGFQFSQIKASPKAYVYKVTNDGRFWYEVFRHKEGRFGVSYPKSKSFGKWAKTCASLDKALTYFDGYGNYD